MPYVLTTEWDAIQERNIDPFSPVFSDNHNKLLKILGKSNMYIDGLDHTFIHDAAQQRIVMQFTKGIVVMNYVCIEFKQPSTIIVLDPAAGSISQKEYYIVVEYEYRKIQPLAVASIKTIPIEAFNDTKHLKLYYLKTGTWSSLPSESVFNAWIANENNFKDLRASPTYLPNWLSGSFMPISGGVINEDTIIYVVTPTEPNQAANKAYVDDRIANHDSEHDDRFVKLAGSTMTSILTLSAHPALTPRDPMGSKQAATKGYVDQIAQDVDNKFNDYVPRLGTTMLGHLTLYSDPIDPLHAASKGYCDNAFVKKAGDTMTGFLTLYANPTTNLHAVTKQYVDTNFVTSTAASNTYVKKVGDTMTGFLTLHANPTSNLHAVTKQYVDTNFVTSTDASNTYVKKAGDTMTGTLKIAGTTKAEGYLYAGSTAPTSTYRLNLDGYFYATRVYNAVYNDFADCLLPKRGLTYEIAKNKIVSIVDNDTVDLADKGSTSVIGVVSDSYAYLAGGSEEEIKNNKKLPICSAGYVWVDVVNIDDAQVGGYVVPDFEGYGKAIRKHERKLYADYIIGRIININRDAHQVRILFIPR